MRLLRIGVMTCCFFWGTTVLAWDTLGHMTVAAVAYEKLTPSARARANDLIKLNPNYNELVATAQKAKGVDQSKAIFMLAATWPDMIKSKNRGYTFDGEHSTKPEASQNIGYADKLQHRYWHFFDIPFSPDGTKVLSASAPNAKTQIAAFRQAISSTVSDDVKSYDLVWLLHVVGDVHQPLHATSRFDKDHTSGDNGANGVTICTTSCTKLHAYWDDLLGTSKSPATAEKIANGLKTASPKLAAVADETEWLQESFRAAKSKAYGAPVGVGKGPFNLDEKYQKAAHAAARQRVALAGVRLANLLNDALK